MVVVLVMVARAATPAVAAGAVFRANVWAANIGADCSGCGLWGERASGTTRAWPRDATVQPSRLHELSPKVEMQIIVVGSGKLAGELLAALRAEDGNQVLPWSEDRLRAEKSVVVHAGSGRELDAVSAFCESTGSALVELATGSALENRAAGFPVILCPNTNLLMLKFMAMLERSGHLFRGYRIALTESHQAQKTSVPGTAVSMAQALGLAPIDIRSVRDADVQRDLLQIPPEHLGRHAYHQVLMEDGVCSVKLETRVFGDAPYVEGVAQIVAAVRGRPLENRRYSIMEFIDNAWL
jgi:4-hydroxy-tetrahydrodipicolinate reductase